MKVLMFGWEFPPHISGGLGTACYGITKGLAANGVETLFVMPSASGDEDQEAAQIINASDIAVYDTITNIDDYLSKVEFLRVGTNLMPYISPEDYSLLSEEDRHFQTMEFSTHFRSK